MARRPRQAPAFLPLALGGQTGTSLMHAIDEIGNDPAARAALLSLNNRSAAETSLLDAETFARMIEAARVATMIGPNAAFLLAFDQHADYESVNFLWFRERLRASTPSASPSRASWRAGRARASATCRPGCSGCSAAMA
jgi:predicted GNAT superfamily acetyltransferase